MFCVRGRIALTLHEFGDSDHAKVFVYAFCEQRQPWLALQVSFENMRQREAKRTNRLPFNDCLQQSGFLLVRPRVRNQVVIRVRFASAVSGSWRVGRGVSILSF